MSALWTAREVATATGGRIAGDWRATSVSIDSRTLRPGALFVALQHVRDGHDFARAALDAGAAAVLVARLPEGVPAERAVVVADTQAGLEALGRAGRARSRCPVVGITGSVGKTGTKAALAHGLGRFGPTHASAKSHNNHWGVPLSLAELPADVAFAVFEMGMSRAGEIRRLTAQVRPHGALITAIAPAHIEFFENEAGIARAKAEIFEGVEPAGFAVVPGDSPHTPLLVDAARTAGIERIATFGDGSAVHARSVEASADGSTVEADVHGRRINYYIGVPGGHWVENSLGLLAVVDALGLDVEAFARSFADLDPEAGRGRRRRLAVADGEAVLIDDSYNANPASVRAALEVLGRFPGRRLAALGAMKELGRDSAAMHADLAAAVLAADVALVFTVGTEMTALAEALPADRRGAHGDAPEAIVDAVRSALAPGDTLLVKGSLASGMGRLVTALVEGRG